MWRGKSALCDGAVVTCVCCIAMCATSCVPMTGQRARAVDCGRACVVVRHACVGSRRRHDLCGALGPGGWSTPFSRGMMFMPPARRAANCDGVQYARHTKLRTRASLTHTQPAPTPRRHSQQARHGSTQPSGGDCRGRQRARPRQHLQVCAGEWLPAGDSPRAHPPVTPD